MVKTSQTIRSRLNNHRNRIKQLCNLYLCNHFNSNGHSIKDLRIMPIEEVQLLPNDNITLASKLLEREDYWIREMCCIYPYGLNDNVRRFGNISKQYDREACMIVYNMFNKRHRKYRSRNSKRRKNKHYDYLIQENVTCILLNYNSCHFSREIRTYVLGLPRRKLQLILLVTEELLLNDRIPSCVAMLIRDLVSYRNRVSFDSQDSSLNNNNRGFMNIYFHNKGIDMVNLPSILHSRQVNATVPSSLGYVAPIVSYTYPRTIAGKIFNYKKAIANLDFDKGTADVSCSCNNSSYKYEPAGHVVTGNLCIIKNRHLRKLLLKGPSYREQSNINWNKVRMVILLAVEKYRVSWAKKLHVDVQVLADWEHEVCALVEKRIAYLKSKHVNWRKNRVLTDNKHLEYLESFQKQFVLVPADKAANNIIVVCRKYYCDVVLQQLNVSNPSTYKLMGFDNDYIINKHLSHLTNWNISVTSELQQLPTLYWLPKLHKCPY